MFINNLNPVALEIFSLKIHWYSLAYIFGIMFGWIYCKKKLIEDKKILDLFDGLINYLIIGIIVGGRAGYIFIYNLDYYLENISEILMIWKGGMSFHGGLIGVIFASIFFAKKNNQNPFLYMDIVALVAPVGLFFGRIANFINSELYGTITNVPWAVTFVQVDNLPRHPSQLYEALLEGLFLFLLLIYFRNKFSNKPGVISGLFLTIYSIFRFIVEFYRVPDEQLGYIFLNLTMGQVVSLIFILSGVILFYLKYETR